ncbi:MAG TPA: hypothetical protein VMV57_08045 [Terracidiphilus sp.]|nr:hypothetical protein [Terracidiphilus sp.]
MSLALVGAMLSSIPSQAQAAGSGVVSHAFVPVVGFFNPAGNELLEVEVITTHAGFWLMYNAYDFGGGFSAGGSGLIPTSSVIVPGASVNAGNVMVKLNVDTCDLTGFTTSYGPCGTIDVTWVELPASVGGSYATRGDTVQTFPGGGKMETNGQTETFSALATGTELGFDLPTATIGELSNKRTLP